MYLWLFICFSFWLVLVKLLRAEIHRTEQRANELEKAFKQYASKEL